MPWTSVGLHRSTNNSVKAPLPQPMSIHRKPLGALTNQGISRQRAGSKSHHLLVRRTVIKADLLICHFRSPDDDILRAILHTKDCTGTGSDLVAFLAKADLGRRGRDVRFSSQSALGTLGLLPAIAYAAVGALGPISNEAA